MRGYTTDIERETLANEDFRRVLYTGKYSQLVVMSIPPKEEIGAEIHHLDQFIRIEAGEGKAYLDDEEMPLTDGTVVIVPSGVKHNIVNTSETDSLKLYTLYAPPNHRDGVVHKTKEDAERDEEHFDGVTSEGGISNGPPDGNPCRRS